MQTTVLLWIAFMSVWALAAMGYDKSQAKRKSARVPEKNIWLLAFLGGGIGAYLGMQVFRHKTRHTSFRIGLLFLALVYAVAILYLFGITIPTFSVF